MRGEPLDNLTPAVAADTMQVLHAPEDTRPRLRGRLHLGTAIASLPALAVLVSSAATTVALFAAWVYGIANVLLYTTSSTYHVFAKAPRTRRIMQSLDHAMIYVLIAGTFTPICLLALKGQLRWVLLAAMWTGTAVGVALALVALERFHKVTFAMYLVLGWGGLVALPGLLDRPGHLLLVATGGLLYTVGAILFALQRPRLHPQWFGYHEVWHLLGVAAGVLLFLVNLDLIRSTT